MCGHEFRLQDSNRRRKGSIQGALQVFRREWALEDKARDLAQGVDAGIGAARALGQGRFAGDPAQRRLQFALYGRFARLNLPAAKLGPVVGQGEFPVFSSAAGMDAICHGTSWITGYLKQGGYRTGTRGGIYSAFCIR